MLGNLTQLVVTTGVTASLLTFNGISFIPDIACGFAGMFGGSIIQLLTIDERNPTKKVIAGEIFSSAVMGFAAYVTYLGAGGGESFRYAFLGAIVLGATGSMGFRMLVGRMWPDQLDNKKDK